MRRFYWSPYFPTLEILVVTVLITTSITYFLVINGSESSIGVQRRKSSPTTSDDLNYPLRLYRGFDESHESTRLVGDEEGVANIVAFVWCGRKRVFEFKHMLAVLAAFKTQKPYRVYLYHWPGKEPIEDLYNSWLTELGNTFFNFEISVMPKDIPEAYSCSDVAQQAAYLSLLFKLHSHGLIYIDEDVILREPINNYMYNRAYFAKANGIPGIIIGRNFSTADLVQPTGSKPCLRHNKFREDTVCVEVNLDKLYPKDVMERHGEFYILARQFYYGSSEKKVPRFDSSNLIPNIGHFYLVGETVINFSVYLSLYSMLSILNVDMVYVHADVQPKGYYWFKLKSTSRVKFVFCPPIKNVFGNTIMPSDKRHVKDVLSLHIIYVYGGIFIDWDAMFVNRLDDKLREYELVLGYDWLMPDDAKTFPECINPGVIAAKKHSVFISMWLDMHKDFGKKGSYLYTGLLAPYKLYERYPETVKLDRHFQVIYSSGTFHPPWLIGYQRKGFKAQFNLNSTYAVHFTGQPPDEFSSEKVLKKSTSFIGEMGKKVMGWN